MKISELKEYKTVNRPTAQFDDYGNRIYQEIEFEMQYSVYSENDYLLRAIAKTIDLSFWLLIFHFLISISIFHSLLYALTAVILINSVTESLTGYSMGKAIIRMKVVDDSANNPGIFRSFLRNLLSPFNLIVSLFRRYLHFLEFNRPENIYPVNILTMNMDFNNIISKTYVLRNRKLIEIKQKLNAQ